LPAIPRLAVEVLEDKYPQRIDFRTRTIFWRLAEELYLGKIDGRSFCRGVVEAAGIRVTPERLEGKLLSAALPHIPALEVLAQLPSDYRIWLVSDYPREWFGGLSSKLERYPFFSPERLIFTADYRLEKLVPEIFPLLVRDAGQPRESCVLIDGDSARAVEAVKCGLPAELYVDAFRLRRSFLLRKMLPEARESHSRSR